jgi:hypothetical protein
MKHCPACNFSFPDFHLVCDFDGTELVPDQRCLALIKLPPRPSFLRRLSTSPKALTAAAILGLFFIAAFIAYQQMTSRSTRTLLAANVATPPLETPATPNSRRLSIPSHSVARSKAIKAPIRAQHSSPIRFVARNPPDKHSEHPSPQKEVVHRSGSVPSEKQPKVIAMLKTTWRVLKRPFSF